MEFVETINQSELINGTSKVIYVKGKDIALFRFNNKITALGNSCLHKGGPLTKGKIQKKYDGYYVTCPWHGWKYNISNGKAPPGYDEQQSVYDVQKKMRKSLFQINQSYTPLIKNMMAL
jgi:nitrite reductase/ring-hydroxylating ferredoxin subunit